MIKCPNCGSTAQVRTITPMYFDEGYWKVQKKCGCGCVIVVRYIEEIDKVELPKRRSE
jgi:hypothetical protein